MSKDPIKEFLKAIIEDENIRFANLPEIRLVLQKGNKVDIERLYQLSENSKVMMQEIRFDNEIVTNGTDYVNDYHPTGRVFITIR